MPVDSEDWWIVEMVGVEGLVLLVGKRRLQQRAGRVRAANVASGWVTPRRDAGIQARIAPGRLCWVGGGLARSHLLLSFGTATTDIAAQPRRIGLRRRQGRFSRR